MFLRGISSVSVAIVMLAGVSARAALPGTQDPAPAAASAAETAVTFTDEQASRGEKLFVAQCAECHVREKMTNAEFRLKWNGKSAFDLFDRMRLTMPETDAGSLPRSQYLDVTAFLAKINGIAPGSVELADDEATLRKQVLALPPQ